MARSSVLYFWHIPKTAGTAFTSWLERHFPAGQLYVPHLLPDLRSTPDGELRGHSLFRGHFGQELVHRLDRTPETVTVLREPRARTVSHLAHIWRARDHYLHDRVRSIGSSLADVLSDPVLRTAVSDMQARYLALDPSWTGGTRVPVRVPTQLLGQAQYELAPLPDTGALVEQATRRLEGLSTFGVAEDLHELASRVALDRGWPVPDGIGRANEAPAESSPWVLRSSSEEELALLDEVNPADTQLYARAVDLIPARTG